jgi:hypothetical protein
MVNLTHFLDLWDILVNEIIGDVWLFFFLSLLGVVIFGALMRMNNQTILLMCLLWFLLMSIFISEALLVFALILTAGWIGWQYKKLIGEK